MDHEGKRKTLPRPLQKNTAGQAHTSDTTDKGRKKPMRRSNTKEEEKNIYHDEHYGHDGKKGKKNVDSTDDQDFRG